MPYNGCVCVFVCQSACLCMRCGLCVCVSAVLRWIEEASYTITLNEWKENRELCRLALQMSHNCVSSATNTRARTQTFVCARPCTCENPNNVNFDFLPFVCHHNQRVCPLLGCGTATAAVRLIQMSPLLLYGYSYSRIRLYQAWWPVPNPTNADIRLNVAHTFAIFLRTDWNVWDFLSFNANRVAFHNSICLKSHDSMNHGALCCAYVRPTRILLHLGILRDSSLACMPSNNRYVTWCVSTHDVLRSLAIHYDRFHIHMIHCDILTLVFAVTFWLLTLTVRECWKATTRKNCIVRSSPGVFAPILLFIFQIFV